MTVVATPASPTLADRRARQLAVVAAVSAAALAALYVVAVRTRWGQELDDIAFAGRAVEDPETTRELNDVLHSVTRSSLVALTMALVLVALARRRVRLAVAVGAAVTGAVATTEMLKLHVLSRPQLDDIAGIAQNSFPSGHATIGMSLSLGVIMVLPQRWRWSGLLAACALSVLFGVGVLATGWHRPSDVFAAVLVSASWFAMVTATLLRLRGGGDPECMLTGEVEDRLDTGAAVVLGVLLAAAAVTALAATFTADSLSTVDFAADYVMVCLVVVVVGLVEVIGYHQSLRGLSLDAPR